MAKNYITVQFRWWVNWYIRLMAFYAYITFPFFDVVDAEIHRDALISSATDFIMKHGVVIK